MCRMGKVRKVTSQWQLQKKRKQTQSRPARGKHVKWTEASMIEAVMRCTNEPKMSVRAAAKQYEIPRATLQSRVNGKIEMGAKVGRKALMSVQLEEKLVDYADNRARMGIGFGKDKFLQYAGKLALKHGCKFKNAKP